MKNIIPALNKLQLACQDMNAPLTDIGYARRELFEAIREALVQAIELQRDPKQPVTQEMVSRDIKFLSQFEKLNGT